MKQKTHSFKSLLFLLILSIPIITIGQNSDKNTITYTSPSKDFLDITIQSHKGLPRFGHLYYHSGVTPPTNPVAYNILIGMKYLTIIYADMDKSKLSNYDNNQKQLKNYHSVKAQNHLKQLAGQVCSDALLEKYFCDTSTTAKCTFIDAYGQRKNINYWGGNRTNQFQQMRSYKSFVTNHLEALQNWSNTFFKKGTEIGYMVSRSSVVNLSTSTRSSKAYDFQKKGYWLGGMIADGGHPIPILEFVAFTENEKKIKNNSSKIFLSINPEKAKKLSLAVGSPLFTVAKVKIYHNKKTPVSDGVRVPFSFELESPIIEVYKDQALTNKIGEINVDKLVFKY